jgi:CRISPR system Cascade subunit CasA
MLVGSGLVYPTFADGFVQEPTATVVVRTVSATEERVLLSYRPSRSLWRELAAIIVRRKADGNGGPLSLHAIRDHQDCDLIVGALARDQANIVDTVESVFGIPSRLSTSEGIIAYQSEVKFAEEVSNTLGWAIEGYRSTLDGGWEGRVRSAGPSKGELKAKLHGTAARYFWTAVEKQIPLLMKHIDALGTDDSHPTRSAWRKMLFSSAREAYQTACGQETPRQMRAFAEGWRRLMNRRIRTAPVEVEDVT